jgi:hypothetical protein
MIVKAAAQFIEQVKTRDPKQLRHEFIIHTGHFQAALKGRSQPELQSLADACAELKRDIPPNLSTLRMEFDALSSALRDLGVTPTPQKTASDLWNEDGLAAADEFITALLESPDPKIHELAFFGPNEPAPPDKNKLYHVLQVAIIDAGTGDTDVPQASVWLETKLDKLTMGQIAIISGRLEGIDFDSQTFRNAKARLQSAISKIGNQSLGNRMEMVF